MSLWGWYCLCQSANLGGGLGGCHLKTQSQFDGSPLSWRSYWYIWRSHCLRLVAVKRLSRSWCLCGFCQITPSLPVSSLSSHLFASIPGSCRMTTGSCPCSVRTLWLVCWTFVEIQRKWRPYWMATWTNVLQAPTTDPASAVLNWPSSTKSRRYSKKTTAWLLKQLYNAWKWLQVVSVAGTGLALTCVYYNPHMLIINLGSYIPSEVN